MVIGSKAGPLKPTAAHPAALSDFIIAAIEEAAPGVDGQAVYMRGFERFAQYCADRYRKAHGLPERTVGIPPEVRRRIARPVTRG